MSIDKLFDLDETIPTWVYCLKRRAPPKKRIWMRQGENTTYVRYTLLKASSPIQSLQSSRPIIVTFKFDSRRRLGMRIELRLHGVRCPRLRRHCSILFAERDALIEPQHIWYRDCFFKAEHDAAWTEREDHLFAAQFQRRTGTRQIQLRWFHYGGKHSSGLAILLSPSKNGYEAGVLETVLDSSPGSRCGFCLRWSTACSRCRTIYREARLSPAIPTATASSLAYHWFGDWAATHDLLPGLSPNRSPGICARHFSSRSPSSLTAECSPTISPIPAANRNTHHRRSLWYSKPSANT